MSEVRLGDKGRLRVVETANMWIRRRLCTGVIHNTPDIGVCVHRAALALPAGGVRTHSGTTDEPRCGDGGTLLISPSTSVPAPPRRGSCGPLQ